MRYDAAETTDENPERVAAVQELTRTYLRTALYPEDPAWPAARAALEDATNPLGRVERVNAYLDGALVEELFRTAEC